MNYLTAQFALAERGDVQAGETVLVHGAAGGVGTATIQVAKGYGARTIAVVSTEFLAGSEVGLGNFILVASTGSTRFDLVLAGTVVAGVLGFLINEGLEQIGKRLFRWSTVDREAIA